MRACFADNAELPIACSIDIDERHNCTFAMTLDMMSRKEDCPHWQPNRAVDLALDILGYDKKDGTYKRRA